jgi:deoxyribose-phosphate aldolase
MTDDRLVEAVVRAVLAQLGPDRHCACHAVPSSCCPDRLGLMVAEGAERFGLTAVPHGYSRELARRIDHTLLKPDATQAQIEALCREAREHGFATVCVNPCWVRLCASLLAGSDTLVCTVAGFPLGATPPEVKAYEAARAVEDGAREVDMVVNVGALKSGDHRLVARDIAAVVDACRPGGAIVKVIIEAALLSDDEKVKACVLARAAGADFVKTSTGFGPGGATAADVALMRRVVGPGMGVKAAGGVRDLQSAKAMIEAGADRIGASVGVKIVEESRTGRAAAPEAPQAAAAPSSKY